MSRSSNEFRRDEIFTDHLHTKRGLDPRLSGTSNFSNKPSLPHSDELLSRSLSERGTQRRMGWHAPARWDLIAAGQPSRKGPDPWGTTIDMARRFCIYGSPARDWMVACCRIFSSGLYRATPSGRRSADSEAARGAIHPLKSCHVENAQSLAQLNACRNRIPGNPLVIYGLACAIISLLSFLAAHPD